MTPRGLTPLEKLCEKHLAQMGYRLRAEYVPGAPPFPDSPEEAQWLAKRETLVLTLMKLPATWVVLKSWTVGGVEESERAELGDADLRTWTADLEARGGWSLPGFATFAAGDGTLEFGHEAYEEFEHDSDSLDLESWKAPRRYDIQRGRNGATTPEATRALLQLYARILPDRLQRDSPLAQAFTG